MKKEIRFIAHAAIIAALYVVLTYAQDFILPNSASFAIQMRLSEMLCVLAFFTPAAIPGLSLGCLIFNLSYAGALPLDWAVGTLATYLAVQAMWLMRGIRFKGLPLAGLLMPALTNAILVGWELTVYIGDAFLLNALFVAIGEAAVLLIFGSILYFAISKRGLDAKLFH
ncbi:MAG: QueT transporter family protein [Eubacteriales bacterium]|nr:QueT transporter family protein [Eubacteriales bacterium]